MVSANPVAITAAVLNNPEAFANAAKTTVVAMGGVIDNVNKAIDALERARTFITNTKSDHAYIVNLSRKEHNLQVELWTKRYRELGLHMTSGECLFH